MDEAVSPPETARAWGSGGTQRPPEPRFLAVGEVIGVHGVRGELKVAILTEEPRRFGWLKQVYVGAEGEEPAPYRLQRYRLHKGFVLLKLQGCDDRDAADSFRGALIQVPLAEALPLEEGEYYEHQVLGLQVWTSAGEWLGELAEILYTGANDVYLVRSAGRRDLLIPAIAEVIQKVDLEAGTLIVQLPEGLLDLA